MAVPSAVTVDDSRAHPGAIAFRRSVETFAREVVAPRAAAIDETGEFPLDVIARRPGTGCSASRSRKSGAARARLRQLRPGDRSDRARQRDGGGRRSSCTTRSSPSCSRTPAAAQQKEQWLRRLATGEAIGAFALSEPDAGTDAANQTDDARSRPATATASPAARCGSRTPRPRRSAIVFACTRPGLRGQGVTAFLVPMDTPGITRTARADSLGVRGLGCMDLEFDVTVGRRPGARAGRPGLSRSRCGRCRAAGSRIAAQALGIGEAALDEAIAYAKRARGVRPADRQLPGDSVDARRHAPPSSKRRGC